MHVYTFVANIHYISIVEWEIFAGAKLRGIAPEGSRKNFCGFNFRGAHTHGEARRYRYSASGNFRGFYFHRSRPIRENFAPHENFPLYRMYILDLLKLLYCCIYMCMNVLPALLCACVLEFILVIAIELTCVKLNLILISVSTERKCVCDIYTCMCV